MAKGITITITRIVDEVRELRPDDPRMHSVWNGTRWVSLASPIWPPRFSSLDLKPEVVTTRLEFLPPGTVTIDALRYRKGYLKEMRKQGVIR